MSLTGVTRFERFFRVAAALDVDKQDLKRYTVFAEHKIRNLMIRAEAAAKANRRDVIQPFDLPITKGLQESVHAFRSIDQQTKLGPLFERITPRPPGDLAYSDEIEAWLPEIVGGLSLALARSFRILDPKLKNPATQHWERIFLIFDTLL